MREKYEEKIWKDWDKVSEVTMEDWHCDFTTALIQTNKILKKRNAFALL